VGLADVQLLGNTERRKRKHISCCQRVLSLMPRILGSPRLVIAADPLFQPQ
jgi:hypothetical protein